MRPWRAARLARTAALVAGLYVVATGHVGSKNVFFSGEAGPWPVSVVIRPPEVIPGLAEVSVRVSGGGADRVTVRPVRWDAAPEGGAPPADVAAPVAGDPELYAAELWLMTVGAYRVEVAVEGARGSGEVSVPVTSVMLGVLDLPPGLGWILAAIALLLVAGVVSITGAAVRESQVPAGEAAGPGRRRRARIAMVFTAVGVAGLLYLGNAWWEAVDRDVRSGIFERLAVEGAIVRDGGTPALEIAITDPAWRGRDWSPLVPDHGKLMHMFVIGVPDMDAFAHVHTRCRWTRRPSAFRGRACHRANTASMGTSYTNPGLRRPSSTRCWWTRGRLRSQNRAPSRKQTPTTRHGKAAPPRCLPPAPQHPSLTDRPCSGSGNRGCASTKRPCSRSPCGTRRETLRCSSPIWE